MVALTFFIYRDIYAENDSMLLKGCKLGKETLYYITEANIAIFHFHFCNELVYKKAKSIFKHK